MPVHHFIIYQHEMKPFLFVAIFMKIMLSNPCNNWNKIVVHTCPFTFSFRSTLTLTHSKNFSHFKSLRIKNCTCAHSFYKISGSFYIFNKSLLQLVLFLPQLKGLWLSNYPHWIQYMGCFCSASKHPAWNHIVKMISWAQTLGVRWSVMSDSGNDNKLSPAIPHHPHFDCS